MNDADAALSLPAVPPTNRDNDRHVEPSLKLAENKIPLQAPPTSDKQKPEGESGGSGSDDTVSIKADSEAETIIQSGREELSPEKKRRYIQHKRDRSLGRAEDERDFGVASLPESGKPRKRLRVESDNVDGRSLKVRDPGEQTSRASSPPGETKYTKQKETGDSEKTSATRGLSHSRFDGLEGNKNRQSTNRWSSEGVRVEEGEPRRHGDRQHVSDSSHNKISDETSNTSHSQHLSKHRSTSPAYRLHHRVTSGSHSSIDIKKRRRARPPPATDSRRQVSEDRESTSSSTSGSPLPSACLRKLASSEQAAISPAKQMQVKKQRDQNGRTRLARACAMQEVEAAKARHAERPEDLNISDNAGNTPLQIAALEGCVDIVKFLIEAGCEIDTRNIDRDTPLIDAVENGHLEVVKLLLDAGANPRLGNAEGDEPYDLVPSDSQNYEEMRKIIAEAKAKGQRRKSADQSVRATSSGRDPSSRGASAASPRDSPPVHGQRSPPPPSLGARRRTVRSEATRNDLLWTKATPENLRDFAAKGDMAGVANILNVGQKADPESLIAAAKGGHDEVLGILLGMGDPDPDPEPLLTGNHNKPGYNTPMLAAIGRGNTAVIQLLLDQRGFDPTRLDRRGRTYYELSRERKGDHWEREYELLKRAYDNHLRTLKNRRPDTKSPRRVRDKDTDVKKHARRESSSPAPPSQRKAARTSDSGRQTERSTRETDHVKERRKPEAAGHEKDKRVASGGNRLKPPNRESSNLDQSAGGSDQETRPDRKCPKDSVPSHNGDEPVKRRRLIAGRPPDRVKRRESLMSSDSLSSREETIKQRNEPANPDVKPSKEAPPRKRSRNSVSPEPSQPRGRQHKEDSVRDAQNQKKRRRVQSEENGISSSNSSATQKPLELPVPPSKTQPRQKNNAPKLGHEKSRGGDNDVDKESSAAQRPNSGTSTSKQDQKKSEPHIKDIPMEDVDDPEAEESQAKEARAANEAREKQLREAKQAKEEEEAKEAKEAREKEAREREAREREAREREAREREAIEREAREAELAKEAREAEERRVAAQAERDRQEKELREAQAAKEAREAEEAREAAETAARLAREKAEEEERKRKEMELRRIRQAEEERQKRLEQERLRLARLRKDQEEQEQRRRDALPNRLRAAANFVGSNDPISKSHVWLKKFMPLVTATTKQIDPSCDLEVKDDRWIPNYLVAPLLATNDLQLSQYPSWERRFVTLTQRNNLWRVTRRILVEEGEFNPLTTSYVDVMRKDAETRPKYFAMEHVFWVKYSDFMDLVPHVPHLHGLEIRTLRMHVDPEPGPETIQAERQLPNGIRSITPNIDSGPKSPLTNGFITSNGHPHS
ncbi:hypothetical protein RJ035_006262 [Blastomyces gilchristii]